MTKSELIELLEDIDGDPEMKIWNGLVEDYVDISPELFQDTLVKETEEHIREGITNEIMVSRGTVNLSEEDRTWIEKVVEKRIKEDEWDVPNRFVKEEDFERWYGESKKDIVAIQPKTSGKTYWDRCGEIKY